MDKGKDMDDFVPGLLTGMLAMFVGISIASWGNDYIFPKHIEFAETSCLSNDGLRKINGEGDGRHLVYCNNGARFSYREQSNAD